MVNISRFTHSYDLGDAVALYHSLRMKPVYLSKDAFEGLQAWLASPFCDKIEKQAPFPVLKYTCRLMQRNGGVSTILYICHEYRIVDGLYAGPVHGRKAACVADAPSRPMPLHRHRANRRHSIFRKRRIRSGSVIRECRARRWRACCRASSGTATTWRRFR